MYSYKYRIGALKAQLVMGVTTYGYNTIYYTWCSKATVYLRSVKHTTKCKLVAMCDTNIYKMLSNITPPPWYKQHILLSTAQMLLNTRPPTRPCNTVSQSPTCSQAICYQAQRPQGRFSKIPKFFLRFS